MMDKSFGNYGVLNSQPLLNTLQNISSQHHAKYGSSGTHRLDASNSGACGVYYASKSHLNRGSESRGPSRPSGCLRVNQVGGSDVAPVTLVCCFRRSRQRLSSTLKAVVACACSAHLSQQPSSIAITACMWAGAGALRCMQPRMSSLSMGEGLTAAGARLLISAKINVQVCWHVGKQKSRRETCLCISPCLHCPEVSAPSGVSGRQLGFHVRQQLIELHAEHIQSQPARTQLIILGNAALQHMCCIC